MGARFHSWRKYIRQHRLLTLGIIVALIAFTLAVWGFGWDWTGFNGGYSQITTMSTSHGTTITIVKPPGKTLWDLLQLLGVLAIPVVVGFGAARYTRIQQLRDQEHEKLQHKRDQEAAKIQHDRDEQLADQRAESERKVAEEHARLEHEIVLDNQREAALQDYIDKMSELLLKEHLGELTADGKLKPEYEQVRNIARVRTITVLFQLDARRIGYVFAFLRETGLMSDEPNGGIISMRGANLSMIDLSQTNISRVNLGGANLRGANLSNARLTSAELTEANLDKADLSNTNLSFANLSGASLLGANLNGALQLHLFGGSLPDGHLGEDLLRVSERRHVGLQGGSHLLQSANGQMLRVAQSVFVSVTMDAAIGHPAGPAFVAGGA